MARLFVAAWPPEDVLDELADLERPERSGVRWTTREQWHVTLRFLGETSPAVALAALETVSGVTTSADVGPVVGRFGRSHLALPVVGLDRIAAAVVAATADVGEPPEDRAFRGHLTMARLRPRARVSGLAGILFSARFVVGDVALVQSELHPDGSRYHTLARVPLG